MPRYNNEDLYGQQTSLMGDVNKYMSANTANVGGKPSTSSNPYGFDLSAIDRIMDSGLNANNMYKQDGGKDGGGIDGYIDDIPDPEDIDDPEGKDTSGGGAG